MQLPDPGAACGPLIGSSKMRDVVARAEQSKTVGVYRPAHLPYDEHHQNAILKGQDRKIRSAYQKGSSVQMQGETP